MTTYKMGDLVVLTQPRYDQFRLGQQFIVERTPTMREQPAEILLELRPVQDEEGVVGIYDFRVALAPKVEVGDRVVLNQNYAQHNQGAVGTVQEVFTAVGEYPGEGNATYALLQIQFDGDLDAVPTSIYRYRVDSYTLPIVMDTEAHEALPVGTEIDNGGDIYRKDGVGLFVPFDAGLVALEAEEFEDSLSTVMNPSILDQAPPFEAEEQDPAEVFLSGLPVGAVVADRQGDRWQRHENGKWGMLVDGNFITQDPGGADSTLAYWAPFRLVSEPKPEPEQQPERTFVLDVKALEALPAGAVVYVEGYGTLGSVYVKAVDLLPPYRDEWFTPGREGSRTADLYETVQEFGVAAEVLREQE